MKFTRTSTKALVAAGVSAAVIGSGAAAYAIFDAATSVGAAPASTPTVAAVPPSTGQLAAARVKAGTSAGTGASGRTAARRQLGHLVIGEVTSVSSSGGAAGVGVISVRTPDGKTVTANLGQRTRIFTYHGPGSKPSAETLTQLGTNQDEMVAVRLVERRAGARPGSAGTGTGSSATPSGSATASGSAGTGMLTAATGPRATGTPYAALIVDLGYAASA
jgi:hypothetical protein